MRRSKRLFTMKRVGSLIEVQIAISAAHVKIIVSLAQHYLLLPLSHTFLPLLLLLCLYLTFSIFWVLIWQRLPFNMLFLVRCSLPEPYPDSPSLALGSFSGQQCISRSFVVQAMGPPADPGKLDPASLCSQSVFRKCIAQAQVQPNNKTLLPQPLTTLVAR